MCKRAYALLAPSISANYLVFHIFAFLIFKHAPGNAIAVTLATTTALFRFSQEAS